MARRRLPNFFRTAEAAAMLAAAATPRDRLIILVGLLMGLRVSEITKLEIPDLNLDEGRAFILEAKGGRDRYVPIPAELVGQLRTWTQDRQIGYLFPSPRGGGRLSSRAVQRMIKRTALAAGLPEANKPRKYTPHKLRHRYASDVLKKVGNIRVVQRLLGHAGIGTTEIYTHVDDEDLARAVCDLRSPRIASPLEPLHEPPSPVPAAAAPPIPEPAPAPAPGAPAAAHLHQRPHGLGAAAESTAERPSVPEPNE